MKVYPMYLNWIRLYKALNTKLSEVLHVFSYELKENYKFI